jgi:hypothetical protein
MFRFTSFSRSTTLLAPKRLYGSRAFSVNYNVVYARTTHDETLMGTMEREDVDKMADMHPAGIHGQQQQQQTDTEGLGPTLARGNMDPKLVKEQDIDNDLPTHEFKSETTIIGFTG